MYEKLQTTSGMTRLCGLEEDLDVPEFYWNFPEFEYSYLIVECNRNFTDLGLYAASLSDRFDTVFNRDVDYLRERIKNTYMKIHLEKKV